MTKNKILIILLFLIGAFVFFAPIGNSAKAMGNPDPFYFLYDTSTSSTHGQQVSMHASSSFVLSHLLTATTTGACTAVPVRAYIWTADGLNVLASSTNTGSSCDPTALEFDEHPTIPADFKLSYECFNPSLGVGCDPFNPVYSGFAFYTPFDFIFPVNGLTTTDFNNWVVNMNGVPFMGGIVRVFSGATSTALESPDDAQYAPGVSTRSFTISKGLHFSISTTTNWCAQATFISLDLPGSPTLFRSPIACFTIDPQASFTPTAITNLAERQPVVVPGITSIGSGGVIFAVPDCDASKTSGSSTLSMWRCNIDAGFKSFLNDMSSGINTIFNRLGSLVQSLFPINVFVHFNNDIKLAQAAATSTPDLLVPYFNVALISSSTPDKFENDYQFKYRDFWDKIIWFVVSLIVLAEGWLIIHHLRSENKGKNV